MDSGVIGVNLSDKLPQGVRQMALMLQKAVERGFIDPFQRKITAQDGSLKNDGSAAFTMEQLLRMDWLCDNIIGTIPKFDEILPVSQAMVRELGIYRDEIPTEKKENKPREDFDHLR
jgi:hypothetical protein